MIENYYGNERPEMLEFFSDKPRRVLDVGCGAGKFALVVKKQYGCETWGIEIDKEAAQQAGQKIDRVLTGSVEAKLNETSDGFFDVIVFNDVLEHLVDPWRVLENAKSKLVRGGYYIISLPNIRHFTVLKMLLYKKDFKYEQDGIMDKTHLRFFTLTSMKRMFTDCGLEIIQERGINKSKSMRPVFLNLLTTGGFGSDSRFTQFGFAVRPVQL